MKKKRKLIFDYIDDFEWLLNKYNNEKLNLIEISNIEGCSKTPVKNRLLKLGVVIRSLQETNYVKIQRKFPLLFNRNWMLQKYSIDKLSSYEIADLIGCTQGLVLINLKRMNIQRRHNSEIKKGTHHSDATKQKLSVALKNAYESGRKTKPPIGKSFSVETEFLKGHKPWNYQGGIVSVPFLIQHGMSIEEWIKTTKTIRKRDRYICQYCGKFPAYVVHHIIPRRIRIDNSDNNLITLCRSCHMKVESITTKYLGQNKDPREIFHRV